MRTGQLDAWTRAAGRFDALGSLCAWWLAAQPASSTVRVRTSPLIAFRRRILARHLRPSASLRRTIFSRGMPRPPGSCVQITQLCDVDPVRDHVGVRLNAAAARRHTHVVPSWDRSANVTPGRPVGTRAPDRSVAVV